MTVDEKVKQLEDLWKKVDAASEEFRFGVRPKGSFTRAEFAARHKISDATAKRVLVDMRKAGKIEKRGRAQFTYYVLIER